MCTLLGIPPRTVSLVVARVATISRTLHSVSFSSRRAHHRSGLYNCASLRIYSTPSPSRPISHMYPPIEPYETGSLKVSDIHTL